MLGDLITKWSLKTQRKDIERFIGGLKTMDSDEVGLVVAQASDWRAALLRLGHRVDDPIAYQASNPMAVITLVKIVQEFQRNGVPQGVPGLMVWIHSLRAANSLELRQLARQMWLELARGFPHAIEAARSYHSLYGQPLELDRYDEFPPGLAPWPT